MAGSLEIKLFNFIRELHQEIVDMRPEDGFSSPRDLGLVKEVNKKSAVFDKLQEAMQIYNPGFEYEPKQEGQKDFSKNPRFDPEWMMKKIDYGNNYEQDYLNIWSKIKDVKSIEELLIAHDFSFNSNTNIKMIIPSILKEIESKDLTFDKLFLFSLIENSSKDNDLTIPYEELHILFKHCSFLDINPLKNMLKDYSFIVLTKSNNPDKVRFVFKIGDLNEIC